MGWRERLAERLFGEVIAAREGQAADRMLEAAESDQGWHGMGVGSARDLSYSELHGSLEQADDAYRNNPLAFRIVELGVDFVLGKGLQLRSSDESAQRWLGEWWGHPLNNLSLRQFELARELSLAGEVFVTLHTNPLDRMTYLRQVPAGLIDEIEVNPEDLEDELRYHEVSAVTLVDGVRRAGKASGVGEPAGAGELGGRWWQREPTEELGWPEPAMRHYAANRLAGTVRGQGDLTTLLPWLRRYKDWLTDRVRLNRYRQAFLFDVTLTGADRRAIVARQSDLAVAPEPGSIIVHNEKESWQAVRPELGATESAADGLALRLMIAAGSGFPLHFLGEAAEANLATATAMSTPTLRRLERRQLYFGWLMVDLARECLRRSGRFGDARDLEIRADFEDLSVEDNERVARAAATVSSALKTAREMGWLGDSEARDLFARFIGEPAIGRDPALGRL